MPLPRTPPPPRPRPLIPKPFHPPKFRLIDAGVNTELSPRRVVEVHVGAESYLSVSVRIVEGFGGFDVFSLVFRGSGLTVHV